PELWLRNSGGGFIALNTDNGANHDARITFAPGTSGTYFLNAFAHNTSQTANVLGTYRLSAADLGPGTDDHPGFSTGAGTVMVGGSVTGNIESTQDPDWYQVTLTAGRVYEINLQGSDSGHGTLHDPKLTLRSSFSSATGS